MNADDFGLTPGINRAIIELHHAGVLTSASLMAKAPATGEAIALARANPSLGIGCHVVLLDGEPVLSPYELGRLVNEDGRFHPRFGRFLLRVLGGRPAAEIEAEASAQIALLRGHGLSLTHIDTHKHTHMFPSVLRPVLRAARAAGIRAVRNPFEPGWSLVRTPGAPLARRLEVRLLRRLAFCFSRIVAEEGFITTGGSLGVLATGTLDRATVESLLSRLPEGTFELVSHPGYNDADLDQVSTRLRASREIERSALLGLPSLPGIELISFAGLHGAAPAAAATV